mmetsp:Transcript_24661/g.38057  ORF Transcript_24661/g.38057 Transcript_24661/m.38057 type:complete len:414 (-) Transcript_24661:358-1599(-)
MLTRVVRALRKDSVGSRLLSTLTRSFGIAPRWSDRLSFTSPESDFSTTASSNNGVQDDILNFKPEWTAQLNFTSPESDFSAVSPVDEAVEEWSGQVSYASPLADFCDSAASSEELVEEWSEQLSFSSPEADFCAVPPVYSNQHAEQDYKEEWSNKMAFASAESDFTMDLAQHADVQQQYKEEWSNNMAFASAESDFTMDLAQHEDILAERKKEEFINFVQRSEYHRETMAYSLSFATAESDFSSAAVQDMLDDRMKEQLRIAERQLVLSEEEQILNNVVVEEIPSLYEEAMSMQDQAVVITELEYPFAISHVNDAWVGLCGFSADESVGKTLNILQGPDTNVDKVNTLLEQLHHGTKVGPTILTNYTKEGRKFHNALQMGPLYNDEGRMTHLIGVLQEVAAAAEGNKVAYTVA